jgi:polyferredoxin
VILVLLFALAFTAVYRRDKIGKYARNLVLIGTLVFIGFIANASLNLGNIASIFMGYIPSPKQHTMWWIMMIGTLGSIVILGRNIYCHQLCPFMVVQDLLQKVSGVKLRIRPEIQRKTRTLIFFLSWLALILIFLSTHPALGSYEPFSMMFSLDGLGIQWYILPITLVGSLFVPKFWCRMFCPVGLYLNEMVRVRKGILGRFTSKGSPRKKTGKPDIEIVVNPKEDK